ncbi:MAG: asparagine synthase B [Candidatus Heimdallarchaeota archaeon]
MCGIAGIFGNKENNSIINMLDKQEHRGPDGRVIHYSNMYKFVLGHLRLSIIDLDGGTQPLSNENNTLLLVQNGEIYNHQKLRKKLEKRHFFKTQSDAEVILHLFEEIGESCVKNLDGMFAFVIWNKDFGLFLARDPIGIKPLYYGYDSENTFYFSSEIKGIMQYVNTIQELPPGSYMYLSNSPQYYYNIPKPIDNANDMNQARQKLDHLLNLAVKKRLMADVPVGVFLSGGLDSSLLSALVKRNMKEEVHSFSVGFPDSLDVINARQVAEYLGTIHHERLLTKKEIFSSLERIIYSLESCDPALIRSAIPTFFVSELASRYVKVVLSGEGADELFAGYHYLKAYQNNHEELSDELYRITKDLYRSNLQRADRMSMAHGLELRVPFLDKLLIKYAFNLSMKLKLNYDSKWILRKVGSQYLPKNIVWRKKDKFSIGTGVGQMLEEYTNTIISDIELSRSSKRFISKEEYFYWSIFKKYYNREDIISNMGKSRSLNPGEIWEKSVVLRTG